MIEVEGRVVASSIQDVIACMTRYDQIAENAAVPILFSAREILWWRKCKETLSSAPCLLAGKGGNPTAAVLESRNKIFLRDGGAWRYRTAVMSCGKSHNLTSP